MLIRTAAPLPAAKASFFMALKLSRGLNMGAWQQYTPLIVQTTYCSLLHNQSHEATLSEYFSEHVTQSLNITIIIVQGKVRTREKQQGGT